MREEETRSSAAQQLGILLSEVPEPYRRVLECRYIRGMRWEDVAEATFYVVSNCQKLHGEGIRILQEILDGREEET